MCKTLMEAVAANSGNQAKSIIKYLSMARISGWNDLTKANLYDFRDIVLDNVASSSARTYFAVLKAIIGRYSEDAPIPCPDVAPILKAKDIKPMKTYLTRRDLDRLEAVLPNNDTELYVLNEFLVSAWTGMRISDVREISIENVHGEFLSYISRKTKVHAVVPMREGIAERIKWLQENDMNVCLMTYNRVIRRLCKRAGINEEVKVFKGGKELVGQKWQFVSSHTGRISFCTCLASVGAGIQEIRRMAGHTTTAMTERYIVPSGIELSEKAMAFFR